MAYTFVVISTVDRIIAFNWDLLCSAPILAPSAFVVSARRRNRSD